MPVLRRRRPTGLPAPVRMPLIAHVALVLLVAVLIAFTLGLGMWWLIGKPAITSSRPWTARESFDFLKIVLTVVGGIGGVVALVVSYRKQQLGEAADTREDARLFGEDFTRATDQLGSREAPVRLAGMYALERLAQNTPSQRQTIVNVLCSYLRMPYTPPVYSRDAIVDTRYVVRSSQTKAQEVCSEPHGNRSADNEQPEHISDEVNVSDKNSDSAPGSDEMVEQERQVRLAAQEILATHLKVKSKKDKPSEFWENIDIDLTGATLQNFNFTDCSIHRAKFRGARFSGEITFIRTEFVGEASFEGARFLDEVAFTNATFKDGAEFEQAEFCHRADFSDVRFFSDASYHCARMNGEARFVGAYFGSGVSFSGTQFNGSSDFYRCVFYDATFFNGARFLGNIRFDEIECKSDEFFFDDDVANLG